MAEIISSFANCRDGDVIYVPGDRYKFFRDLILPQLQHKVILVSSLYDVPKADLMLEILKNENVVHWFAINVHIDHPRVTPLPIGVSKFLASFFRQLKNIRLVLKNRHHYLKLL